MPVYRLRYRRKDAGVGGAWTTYVDPVSFDPNPVGPQTDTDGDVDTGALLGGSVSIGGLTNGVQYEFVVDRMDGGGGVARSSAIAEETPAVPSDTSVSAGAGSVLSDGNGQQTVSAQLTTRNSQRGVYIVFGNASWSTARLYFRSSVAAGFPGDPGDGDPDVVGFGSPNLTVTRQAYSVVAAQVTGSGDPATQCFKIDNKTLFVPFDYATYDLRVRARYASADLSITVEAP